VTILLDETHDPARRSFVANANVPGCDFPIQNLPFGAFRPVPDGQPRVGVAIGDQILDVSAAAGVFDGLAAAAAQACSAPFLNPLMAMGPQARSALRLELSRGLSADGDGDMRLRPFLTPMARVEMSMPVAFRNFTDFFASIFHATNAGRLFRPDNLLSPNYKYVPVAYHSRASSVCISGAPVSGRAANAKDRTARQVSRRHGISTSSSSSARLSAPLPNSAAASPSARPAHRTC